VIVPDRLNAEAQTAHCESRELQIGEKALEMVADDLVV
jgi:hypothetical protein